MGFSEYPSPTLLSPAASFHAFKKVESVGAGRGGGDLIPSCVAFPTGKRPTDVSSTVSDEHRREEFKTADSRDELVMSFY